MNRRTFVLMSCKAIILSGAGAVLLSSGALAGEAAVFTGYIAGVGAGGFDVVAYQSENAARPGSADMTAVHDGVTYRFASAGNRDRFSENPEKYLPQFGGYCAYAVSQGATAPADPEVWNVVDGKLYLNYSPDVRSIWRKDPAGYIAKANAHWPDVLK